MNIPEPLTIEAYRTLDLLLAHADLEDYCVEDGSDPVDGLEVSDLVISYDGPDNDEGTVTNYRLACLTEVPDGLLNFTLTRSPQTDVPILLVSIR